MERQPSVKLPCHCHTFYDGCKGKLKSRQTIRRHLAKDLAAAANVPARQIHPELRRAILVNKATLVPQRCGRRKKTTGGVAQEASSVCKVQPASAAASTSTGEGSSREGARTGDGDQVPSA